MHRHREDLLVASMLTEAGPGEATADIAPDQYARAKGLGTISGSDCQMRRGAWAFDGSYVPDIRGRWCWECVSEPR